MIDSTPRRYRSALRRFVPLMISGCLMTAGTGFASDIFKANTTDNLNLPTAWAGGVVPGPSDVGVWDATVSDPNSTTNFLGANLSWGGIRIANPAGTVQLVGNTLTNGAAGIDMTAATVDLNLSNAVFIAPGALQQWNVAPGRTLTLAAIPTKPGQAVNNTGVLQIGTTGTVRMGTASTNLIVDNQGNPWATYGQNDWAALDSSGTVIAATYQNASSGFAGNVTVDTSLTASGQNFSSLRFDLASGATFTISGTGTATARGILVTTNAGPSAVSGTTAFIRPNRSSVANTAFNIIQNSPSDFTIAANIANGSSGAPTHVVKSGPGNLILAHTGNGYTGGTEINGGTLTAAAGARVGTGGPVNINAGRLVLTASNTTTIALVTVFNGATNSIKIPSANAQQFIPGLTFSNGLMRSEFNFGNGVAPSTTTAPLLASNLVANGTITVDIYSGSITATGIYPLIKYTNAMSGSGTFVLGTQPLRIGGYLTNDTVNADIAYVVTNITSPIHWAAGNGTWDVATSANWKDATAANTTYQQLTTPYSLQGDAVVFDDTASGASPISVTLNANVGPAALTVNASKDYSIAGTGSIEGLGTLTKSGSGTLTLSTANSFSGGLALNGGVVNFSALTNLGSGPISFNGGTLQYNGNQDDISMLGVTLNAGGGTIDTEANAPFLSNPLNGVGGLTKTGSGSLTLNGTNRYTGPTVVSQGTLALSGSTYISNSTAIIVNSGATLDVNSSPLTLSTAANQVLAGSGTISGPVTITNATTITPGTNGVAGTLTVNGDVVFSGGTYPFDVSSSSSDLLQVNGNLTLNSGTIIAISAGTLANGSYKLIQYTGSLFSGAGSSGNLTLTGFSQPGKTATLSDAVPGEIDLVVADLSTDSLTWSGSGPNANWDLSGSLNWLKGATGAGFVNGDLVTFDDTGAAQPTVFLQTTVLPGSVTVNNNTTTYTFADGTGTGGAKISGTTGLTKDGTGTLIIQTDNNNSGPTLIKNGTLQVGNGSIGSIGTGPVTNNGALVFSQNADRSVGSISGSGTVTQSGSGTVTLAGDNTYQGITTVTSGTLQIGAGTATAAPTNAIVDNSTVSFDTTSLTRVPTNISGSGSVRLQAASTKTLTAVNQYLGNTYIDNGTLVLSGPDLIPDLNTVPGSTGWLILDGGATFAGTLDLNGFNETVNALSGLGNTVEGVITNSSSAANQTNTLTVLGQAATTFNGIIADNPTGAKVALMVHGATELRLNGNSTFSGGITVGDTATIGAGPGAVLGTGGIVLSNGTTLLLHNGNSSASVNVGNAVTIPDNSVGTISSTSLGSTFSGTIIGSATATNQVLNAGDGISYSSSATKQLQSFNGLVLIPSGSHLRFSASQLSVNGGDNATFQVDGNLDTRNGTGSGAGVSLGALTGSGTLGGAVSADGNGLYVIGAKNIDSEFTGTISGTPPRGTSITKVGTGNLTLSGSLSYVGTTTISNGVMTLAGGANLDASPTINVRSPGVLDVNAIGGVLYLGNSTAQTLAGACTIRGSVTATGGNAATILPGDNIGTLTITNVLTLAANSAITMELNRTNAGATNDMIVAGSIIGNGTLTITNIGPGLVNGDTFKLFNSGVSGFTTVVLPTGTNNNYVWNDQLAVDGTIQLTSGGNSPVATNPTNITFTATGGQFTLSWPSDHLGWHLQAQTNAPGTGITTNWFDVTGSSGVTQENLTIVPTNGSVFYRLVYP